MTVQVARNQQLLKNINRMALVRHLCSNAGLSRVDLAMAVGLQKSTVSSLVRELLEEGWLMEREVVATGDLGRRPTPLFIDPTRLLLLGAEVGIDSIRVVATSLTGDVLATAAANHDATKTDKASIAGLAAALLAVRKQLAKGHHKIIGIGVGLPGGVEEASGFLHFAPNLGWRDVPFGTLLTKKLKGTALAGVPLFVQNDADVGALGEMEFSSSDAADPLLYVKLGQGVGAGVIVGQRLLTGNRGFAGEVGHIVLQIDGPQCSCGRRGCAEALIGPRVMLRWQERQEPTLDDVQRRLAEGDADTIRAVKKAGSYLGVLLQNLTAAYDPGCIVLSRSVVDVGETYLNAARSTLNAYANAAGLAPPSVRTSRFGADSIAIGAAALVRYRLTRPLAGVASDRHHVPPEADRMMAANPRGQDRRLPLTAFR